MPQHLLKYKQAWGNRRRCRGAAAAAHPKRIQNTPFTLPSPRNLKTLPTICKDHGVGQSLYSLSRPTPSISKHFPPRVICIPFVNKAARSEARRVAVRNDARGNRNLMWHPRSSYEIQNLNHGSKLNQVPTVHGRQQNVENTILYTNKSVLCFYETRNTLPLNDNIVKIISLTSRHKRGK